METFKNPMEMAIDVMNDYPSLAKLGKKIGDFLETKNGRRYRIENPSDEADSKLWGKDHVLLREIDADDNEVYDFGSYGWFPIGEWLKK